MNLRRALSTVLCIGIVAGIQVGGCAENDANVNANSSALPVSSISGTVLDHSTKKPVGGLIVTASIMGNELFQPLPNEPTVNGQPMAVTDENGHYRLSFTTDVRTRLNVDVYIMSSIYGGISYLGVYRGEAAQDIALNAFPTSSPVICRMVDTDGRPAARTVEHHTGVVLGVDAKTARELRVYGGTADPRRNFATRGAYWQIAVDASGRYTMDGISEPGGSSERLGALWVFPVRDKALAGEPVHVEPGQKGVELRLYPNQVKVLVRDIKGNALGNISVRCRLLSNPTERVIGIGGGGGEGFVQPELVRRHGMTDDIGSVVLRNLKGGLSKISVISGDRALKGPQPKAEAEIEVGKEDFVSLVCDFDDDRPILTGFVIDEHGRPVLHAVVEAGLRTTDANSLGGRAWTEVDGHFQMAFYPTPRTPVEGRLYVEQPDAVGQVRIRIMLKDRSKGPFYEQQLIDQTSAWPERGERFDIQKLAVRLPQ